MLLNRHLSKILKFTFCESKTTKSKKQILEKMKSKQELNNYVKEVNNYKQRGGIMLKYMIYRKYEMIGLLLASISLYVGYKIYSIAGFATNPFTNKKKIVCMNEQTQKNISRKIERVFTLEKAEVDKTTQKILNSFTENFKQITTQILNTIVIDTPTNVLYLLPNNQLIISKRTIHALTPSDINLLILINKSSLKLQQVSASLSLNEIPFFIKLQWFYSIDTQSSIKLRSLYAHQFNSQQLDQCLMYMQKKYNIKGNKQDLQKILKKVESKKSNINIVKMYGKCF